MYGIIICFVELLSAITGTLYIKKHSVHQQTRYLVYFLWLTVSIESFFAFSNWVVKHFLIQKSLVDSLHIGNTWIYLIYGVISGVFYINYFKNQIESPKTRKLLNIFIYVFICFYVAVSLTTNMSIGGVEIYPMMLFSLFVTVAVVYYALEYIHKDTISTIIEIPFFVGIGVSLFHILIVPFFLLYKINQGYSFFVLLKFLLVFSNILLYGLYTFGFIFCWKQRKKEPQKHKLFV